jgi:hypothetical protein
LHTAGRGGNAVEFGGRRRDPAEPAAKGLACIGTANTVGNIVRSGGELNRLIVKILIEDCRIEIQFDLLASLVVVDGAVHLDQDAIAERIDSDSGKSTKRRRKSRFRLSETSGGQQCREQEQCDERSHR